ncbi:MAG: hypothetical protein ACI81R_003097 [Bradymonadia bacterium]|jgi:hypothetical protein
MKASHFRHILAAALLFAATGCAEEASEPGARVTAADVSFLMPLGAGDAMMASSLGGHGTLLPRSYTDLAETLTRVDEPDDLYAALQVVAVRLDSCFSEGSPASPCASQVRLVFQPVFAEGGAPITRDASLHAFYEVPVTELRLLAVALAEARETANGSESVGVSSVPNAAVLLLTPHLGEARLSRMTFMAVHASDEAWTFGGFDIAAGDATTLAIPGTDDEQHVTSVGHVGPLEATILPEPTIEPDIIPYLVPPSRGALDDAQLSAAQAALERLMSPADHNPGTVDCATCHVATTALRFVTSVSDPGRVSSVYDDTRNQRMFGWYGAEPSVSPRVLAETEGVLARLQSEL